MKSISKLLTEHPASVNQSYFRHMMFAAGCSASLFMAGFAALIHALLPFTFERTASRIVERLYAKTHSRAQSSTHDPDQINPALRRNGL